MAIDKIPSGKWRARFQKNGKRLSKTFSTKAQAQEWLRVVDAEVFAQLVGAAPPGKTLRDLLQRYSEEISITKRGERFERLRLNLFCRDPISDALLSDLSPAHFSEWRDRRLKSVSASSVLREMNLLSSALTTAVKEWGWLKDNPMMNIQRPKSAPARTRRFSVEEIERLLFVLGYTPDADLETVTSRVGAAMLFAIETAMRAGEICGLTWARVDLKKRIAHLDKTKNGHARDVPLSKEALRLLKQLRGVDEALVFGLSTSQLDALFRKARGKAGIEDLHFHDTRREALTRLAGKVDVLTLAKISGHRDLKILSNVYYKPDMSEVANSLD